MERKLAYLVPEFPGQTHVWIWREMVHMREWGVSRAIFSTRRPPERDRARHAFAREAEEETSYLWPAGLVEVAAALAWAFARPVGLLSCVWLAITIPIDRGPRWKKVWPLLVPACILSRRLARGGFRHVHSHSCASSAILAMMAKRLAGVDYSLTLNANIEWWGGAMEQKFGEAGFVIAITRLLLERCRSEFPAIRDRFLLGRIGVDTRKWDPARHRRGDAVEGWRVVSVGRLHPSKGYDVLIRAVGELAAAGCPVGLTLIGSGPAQGDLERLIGELRVGARVRLAGSLSEDAIIAELGRADVFVLSSHAEPLGVVVMEAMALGLPTIGTNAGGVGEIIEDGVDGVLVPPGDPAAIAAAISRLMEDPARRGELGRSGRAKIEREFDSRIGAATLHRMVFGVEPASSAEGVGAAA